MYKRRDPYRSKAGIKEYQRYMKALQPDAGCDFCTLSNGDDQFVAESHHFKIIKNRFPYTRWDALEVVEHLMVVPKQHTDTLKDLTPSESKEYVEIIADYENAGYDIYARAPHSEGKTVVHQHTHIIKTQPKEKKRSAVGLAKPYIRIGR